MPLNLHKSASKNLARFLLSPLIFAENKIQIECLRMDEKNISGNGGGGGGVCIFFMLPRGKTKETCSEDLSDAFDQSTENGLSPIWITTDQTLSKTPSKTVIIFGFPIYGTLGVFPGKMYTSV